MDWRMWLKGLVAAVIGAVAGALFDVISNMVSSAGHIDWTHVEGVALGTAVVALLGYLKRSPLPPIDSLPGGQRATDPPSNVQESPLIPKLPPVNIRKEDQ